MVVSIISMQLSDNLALRTSNAHTINRKPSLHIRLKAKKLPFVLCKTFPIAYVPYLWNFTNTYLIKSYKKKTKNKTVERLSG